MEENLHLGYLYMFTSGSFNLLNQFLSCCIKAKSKKQKVDKLHPLQVENLKSNFSVKLSFLSFMPTLFGNQTIKKPDFNWFPVSRLQPCPYHGNIFHVLLVLAWPFISVREWLAKRTQNYCIYQKHRKVNVALKFSFPPMRWILFLPCGFLRIEYETLLKI